MLRINDYYQMVDHNANSNLEFNPTQAEPAQKWTSVSTRF